MLLDGIDLSGLDDDSLSRLRRRKIGFVFRVFNLIPVLTLQENVALPLVLDGRQVEANHKAVEWLVRYTHGGIGHTIAVGPDQHPDHQRPRANEGDRGAPSPGCHARAQVSKLILAESLLLGIVGASLGLPRGLALGYRLTTMLAAMMLPSMSFSLPINGLVVAVLVVVVMSLVASFIPGRQPASLHPVGALRYE